MLRLERASKRFGALVVIDDLSMQLGAGEALGVIGPNGAGKTTLFNLITGGVAPDAGRIFLQERDITALLPHERCRIGLGRSYQIPHPFVGMSVFENLLVGASFGTGKPEKACHGLCADILERTGLIAKANALAGSLTLLERKQLEMARALASQPRVLLLDEIAGGLTEAECGQLVQHIQDIRAGGVSVIWIEHIVHALMSVVDRLMVINFGRIVDDGDPATVMASPDVQQIYMGISAE
ncbi:MAG TPA: ABC transporter ATP-binding protein [Alphaproteobacteria bacterium]|nr:ABC transporter ATP-binding protein [Alphaproteobacteria bacterium]